MTLSYVEQSSSYPEFRSAQEVFNWRAQLQRSVEDVKNDAPTIEKYVPQIGELERVLHQDWGNEKSMDELKPMISTVKRLWDGAYKDIWRMEQEDPSLKLCHLMYHLSMYPHTNTIYSYYGNLVTKARAAGDSFRILGDIIGTAIFGTTREMRRLVRETSLYEHNVVNLTKECDALTKLVQEHQPIVEQWKGVRDAVEVLQPKAAVVVDNVEQVADKTTAVVKSWGFFTDQLTEDLTLYAQQSKEKLVQVRAFEDELLKMEQEVRDLLAENAKLDALLNEIDGERTNVARATKESHHRQHSSVDLLTQHLSPKKPVAAKKEEHVVIDVAT